MGILQWWAISAFMLWEQLFKVAPYWLVRGSTAALWLSFCQTAGKINYWETRIERTWLIVHSQSYGCSNNMSNVFWYIFQMSNQSKCTVRQNWTKKIPSLAETALNRPLKKKDTATRKSELRWTTENIHSSEQKTPF